MSPTGAFFIGIGGGLVVICGTDALEYLRIDDPIGAVPVHMIGGIWGTLSLGLFATGAYGAADADGNGWQPTLVKGLFYGGGFGAADRAGASAAPPSWLATLVASFALMYAVKATGTLRVSREGELMGLDLHEHGMLAYPEYVIHGFDPTPH